MVRKSEELCGEEFQLFDRAEMAGVLSAPSSSSATRESWMKIRSRPYSQPKASISIS